MILEILLPIPLNNKTFYYNTGNIDEKKIRLGSLVKVDFRKKNYVGLASLGNKPTFSGSEKILEVYILDFDEDIYSQNIEVHFLEEIRKQIKFSNQDELIKQMNEDHKYAIINSKKYGI